LGQRHHLLLQIFPLTIHLAESGGDDDPGLGPALSTLLNDAQNMGGGNDEDGQINGLRDLGYRGVSLKSEDFRLSWVDRIDPARVSSFDYVE
jgi:hypothetical protein